MTTPALRRRPAPTPRLEDTTEQQRRTVTGADLVRLRRGNAAEVWQLTLHAPHATVVAETLFTLPLTATGPDDATDRAGSLLAAIDLTPTGWDEIRPGHLHTPINSSQGIVPRPRLGQDEREPARTTGRRSHWRPPWASKT